MSTALAFEVLSGVATEAVTALQMARFTAGRMPDGGGAGVLVVGISVSGSVTRTAEAIAQAAASAPGPWR